VIILKLSERFLSARLKRVWRGTLVGILIGIVSGLGGIVFNFLLQTGTRFFTSDLITFILPANLVDQRFLGFPIERWMMLWIPALGGLIAGIIVFSFAPEAEGHGTDAMIDTFHRKKGIVRKRVPFIKTVASAITIGSGGSAGKEGPIAQIGSSFGSILGSMLKVSDRERRIMLLAGAAGGIGAIFKAPLGAALFVTEVLYRKEDFEFEAFIPCILSSITGFMVFTFYDGTGTIFHIPQLSLATPIQLPFYIVLGIICAAVGYVYIRFFYGARDHFFRWIRISKKLKPAVGGLLVGILAFFVPEILGGGYKWIQAAIDGQVVFQLMSMLVFAKIAATAFTISSGGSGGVFAPSLYIGSMIGGAFGSICSGLFPHIITEPAAFVLVGMGGFFACVAKVPIAALIMVAEMSGGYSLIIPMMIVSTISYLLLGNISLYEKQVPTRVDSPSHIGDFAVDIMDSLGVKDAMEGDWKTDMIPEGMRFNEILKFMVSSHQQDFPVVDGYGNLTGIISMTDMREAMADTELHNMLVAKDIAIEGVVTVTMNDSLNTALKLMSDLNVRELPVVDEENRRKVLSIISRKDITRAYHQEIERAKGHSITEA
jgi:chloride channel protein, CIC family